MPTIVKHSAHTLSDTCQRVPHSLLLLKRDADLGVPGTFVPRPYVSQKELDKHQSKPEAQPTIEKLNAMAALSKPLGEVKAEVRSVNANKKLSIFGRIFRDFVKAPERRRLLIAIIALIVSSSTNLAFPTIIGRGIDYASNANDAPRLRIMLTVALSVFGAGALASWLRVYSFKLTAHRVEQRMRKRLFECLMLQDCEFLAQQKMGDLSVRLLQDVEVSSKALTENIAQSLRGLNSSIGGTTMLILLSPRLTLVTMSLVPILGVGSIFYRKKVKKLQKQLLNSQSKSIAVAEERLSNIETVRLFGKEKYEAQLFSNELDNIYESAKQVCSSDGLMMGGISFAANTSLLAVLCFGGSLVRRGHFSIGNLASFALYSSMVGLGFSSLFKVYGELVKASVSAERVYEILDKQLPPTDEDGVILDKVTGEICFEGVDFAYVSRPEVKVLKNLSLTILPGQVVAIAGASGSGKTTASRLLTRLLQPQHGKIKIDGHDISTLNATWLRENVFGVVNQEPVLFDLSIAQNIAYSRPNATFSEIQEASKKANADDFISKLPEGYHTLVGERGIRLSGGEKQRIAIARAVLKNPPCLILDEATSSLDGESERLVQQALERLMHGRTTLMIAHRASTLEYAHRIEVLKDGEFVESGTYDHLVQKPGGVFASLALGVADHS